MAPNENNHHGLVMENQIASILRSKKYTQFTASNDGVDSIPWFIPQYRKFETLYKTQMRLDFLVFHPEKWPDKLALECKWQSSGGTVDEKFPYLVLSLAKVPEASCAVLLAGGGYRAEALDWLKRQQTDRLSVIEGLDSIVKWANIRL